MSSEPFQSTLVIGDLHIKKDYNAEPMLTELVKISQATKPERIVILGDVLHTHEKISMHCHNRAVKFFQELAEISVVYVIIGNHDRQNNSDFLSDMHPFYGIDTDRIKIIAKPLKEDGLIFVPYVPTGRFMEALDTLELQDDFNDIDFIFAHQEFKGAQLGCKRSKKGDEWPAENPMIISGHVHEHQIIGNIMYLGTPIQHSFGESSKKFVLLITETKQFKSFTLNNIKKKKILHLSYDEFMNLEHLDDNVEFKIIVSVSKAQSKMLKNNAKYLAFNKIAKMSLNLIEGSNMQPGQSSEPSELMSLDDVMIKKVLKDNMSILVYKELFNIPG